MLHSNLYKTIIHKRTLAVLVVLFYYFQGASQSTVYLSVENEVAINNDYYFDIYFHSTNSNNPIYLGSSDLVFTFNTSSFSSPEFFKVGSETGYCTFRPLISNSTNDKETREDYFEATSVNISHSLYLVINLDGPTPTSQDQFNTRIARIDENQNLHCLGRFRISGLIDENVQLKWKVDGIQSTQIYQLEDADPWNSYTINIITCLDKLTISNWPMQSDFQAKRIKAMGMAESGSNISLKGGQSIELAPGFTAQENAQLQIMIQGCQE